MEIDKLIVRKLSFISWVVLSSVSIAGCVSETLSTQNTQPIAVNQQNDGDYDPSQRAQAVAEIRQKAADADSGVPTNAYAAADGPNEPPSPEAGIAKIEALQQVADRNAVSNGDEELAAKQRRIRELQQKARTHYSSAVNKIEN